MKKGAILGILAALAALGAVLAMSGSIYAIVPPLGAGQASAHAEVTAPGDQDVADGPNGGSVATAEAYMDNGSSGDASATANASNDTGSTAIATAYSNVDNGSSGDASATANAAATGYDSAAFALAVAYIGPLSDPTTTSVANATATNGGVAVAEAIAAVWDGGTGNNTAYAYANSTGSVAISNTDIETGAGADTPAAGFYYDIYSSGDNLAFAWLFVPGLDNIIGFTYTNAGSTDAYAGVVVEGSDVDVIAIGVLPP